MSPPRSKIPPHSYIIGASGIYLDAFKEPYRWDHTPMVLTDELNFQLKTKESVQIKNVGEDVHDLWGESDTAELQRLKAKSYAHQKDNPSCNFKNQSPDSIGHLFLLFYFRKSFPRCSKLILRLNSRDSNSRCRRAQSTHGIFTISKGRAP